MKRIIYGFAFTLFAVSAMLVACNKEQVSSGNTTAKKPQSNIEKSLTDAQLISIIRGMDPNYTKIGEVEEVLFDHCQLSSSVIRALIDESKYPDYIVEEMMILSAPVSSADLTYLHAVRPGLSTSAIASASSVDWSVNQYGVLNSSPRQIVYAKGLSRTALCPTNCGESEWHGNDLGMITLTSTTTPLDPSEMVACDQGKWVCGKLTQSRIVLADSQSTYVVSKCEGTTGNCTRKVDSTK